MFGIYIHWPYCLSKCPYCDFNSHVAKTIDHQEWRDAYTRELSYTADLTPERTVTSIFFGGGTPSLMDPQTVEHVLSEISEHWSLADDLEITLEANPTSVEQERFQSFRDAGINRVSLGIQSLKDEDLKFLGRQHSAEEGLQALKTAQKTFDRTSFDLIYARPDQSVQEWEKELEEALNYAEAGHLSLYQLTIEPGTAFETMYQRREFDIPDDHEGGKLYELTRDLTEAYGLSQYEISNYARTGEESRHNLTYWRYQDYAGIGPGAHGRLTLNKEKNATRTHRAPGIWLEKTRKEGHGYHPFESLGSKDRGIESVLMGLRLEEGLPLQRIEEETETSWDNILDQEKIMRFVQEGYMMIDIDSLKLSPSGFQRLEGILKEIIQ